MNEVKKPDWVCIECGEVLGHIIGGELQPIIEGKLCRTRGPHLVVTCPKCTTTKTFYTSDTIVRAVYQLIDAIASVLAQRVLSQIGQQSNIQGRKEIEGK
jgi:hypothetical protein